MLIPFKLPPGIANSGTEYETAGRWRDCNFVRWVEGVMRPIGGWRRITREPLTGKVGGMFPFRDNRDFRYIAVGTHNKAYIVTSGSVSDVTPTGLVAGREDGAVGLGFGTGPYDKEAYGTERSGEGGSGIVLGANTWSFDSWGEFLVACSSADGRLWLWKPGDEVTTPDATLSQIPNSPIDCRGLAVTAERHLLAVGADGDPRKIAWSDREDYTTWAATATNLAGEIVVQTSGTLTRAIRVSDAMLLLSDTDAHLIQYVGAPLAYGIVPVGEKCGLIGPNAVAVAHTFAVWMGTDGFYLFNGQVQPVPCEVWDWVFRSLDPAQGSLVSAGHNAEFSEIWWHFPASGSRQNNRYVIWNYRENHWSIGYLARAHWMEKGVWDHTAAAGTDGHIYEHEIPLNESGLSPRSKPYVQAAPLELGNGERVLSVLELVPDRDSAAVDALQFKFSTRFAPRLPETVFGPFRPSGTGFIPVRFQARQAALRVEAVSDVDWRLGVLRADVKPGGKR